MAAVGNVEDDEPPDEAEFCLHIRRIVEFAEQVPQVQHGNLTEIVVASQEGLHFSVEIILV